jgi:peptidoglycan-associated lipoprotein
MLKKLFVLVAIISLAACQHKSKDSASKSDENQVESTDETYQTVDSVKEAEAMDQQTQAAIQEIEVQDRVFFGYDSSDLSTDAKKILDSQVSWLKSDPNIKVTIEGHCDERGTREYNIALGEKRANSSKKYLVANGIDASRIQTVSYGKERPAFFGSNEDVLAKNRRAVTVAN